MSRFLGCAALIAVVMSWSCGAVAQESAVAQGNALLMGGFAFVSAGGDAFGEDGDRMTTIAFAPSYGRFVATGLAVGGELGFARQSLGDESFTTWMVGPYLRWFPGAAQGATGSTGATHPYLATSVSLLMSSYSSDWGDDSESGFALSMGGGAMHMLTDSVALLAEAAWEIESIGSASGNQLSLTVGLAGILR